MSYNFLKDAKYIRNSMLCRYDTTHGFTTEFSENGNVDGWDIYNNIYMYGCWGNTLFGTSYLKDCYIGRSTFILSVDAEKYFFIEFMMKIDDNNKDAAVPTLTKGKIAWQRADDSDWSSSREVEFEIKEVDVWQYYKINVGPYREWQATVNDLRFYPFIDGREGDQFFLKFLRITSEEEYTCTNTQCSFYSEFEHPCKGVGQRAYCEASIPKDLYTTVSGQTDFIINIDDYGDEVFLLNGLFNMSGTDAARVLSNNISTVNTGGYSYSEAYYTDEDTLRIYSGTSSDSSEVVIPYTKVAQALGFYNELMEPSFINVLGTSPATGFDYASTRLLQTYEINSIINGKKDIAYTHEPNQYSVEVGRRDFNEIGTSELISEITDEKGYVSFNNKGNLLVDFSHRVDNNGKLTNLWVYGIAYENASFKILRPHNDGGFTVIHEVLIQQEDPSKLYTKLPQVSKSECNILVNKGDLLAVYDFDIYVGKSMSNLPDATFCIYKGETTGRLPKTSIYSYGVGGIALYGRGRLAQSNTILDIDLGSRVNISEFRLFGKEKAETFEYNIASCLDVEWSVDLFGETHKHWIKAYPYSYEVVHTNLYYGKECLDDSIVTTDNGIVGDTYTQDNGLATFGKHSYFYVNGDAEWVYEHDCSKVSEFCGNAYCDSAYAFDRDPIEFTLFFPNNVKAHIHKSIIYFKEKRNFRNLTLSTYNGPYYTEGDDRDSSFTRVPKYLNVNLNGLTYNEGTDDNVDRYVFKNPMTDDLYSFDDYEKNKDRIASVGVDWQILGHEFNPVECKGFRIYTNKHYSTKIIEIEVFSKTSNDASLTDNAVLYFSDYGDIWRTAGFNKLDEESVSSFIGATPRYLRLHLESQSEFYLNEIDITVTEQVYIEEEVVLLKDAMLDSIGRSTSVEIINTYDKPFDLTVDIPRDVGITNNITLWNKLGSDKELNRSEIGPKPIVYKSNDFPITMYHGQCAANNVCYGLQNLINNKDSYFSYNNYDWYNYNTLYSGIDVNFTNEDYLSMYKNTYTAIPVSSKYFRLSCILPTKVCEIKDIIFLYLGDEVSISRFYYGYPLLDGTNYKSTNGKNLNHVINFEDNFSSGSYGNFIITGNASIVDNHLHMDSGTSYDDAWTITSQIFNNTKDFEFYLKYFSTYKETQDNPSLAYMGQTLILYDSNIELFKLNWNVSVNIHGHSAFLSEVCSTFHELTLFDYVNNTSIPIDISCIGNYFVPRQYCYIKILRSGDYVSIYLRGSVHHDAYTHLVTFILEQRWNVTKFTFRPEPQNVYAIQTTDFYVIEARHRTLLAQGNYVDVELVANNPIDSIQIINTCEDLNLDLYTSYNNVGYYYHQSLGLTSQELSIQFVIDLVNRHHIDIIRNYGEENSLNISDSILSYSNSESDISNTEFNSSKEDCRWLAIAVYCSDGIPRKIDKLGVYPNLKTTYCLGGGYNHTWDNLGVFLTQTKHIHNVAYGSLTTSETYRSGSLPENAVDGISSSYDTKKCWGFTSDTVPTIFIDFEKPAIINKVNIYGGYHPQVTETYNKEYTFYVDNTVSGTNYVEVFNSTSISNKMLEVQFDPIEATRIKLEVNDFEGVPYIEEQDDGAYKYVYVGYIREIEIYNYIETEELSSEKYPVVGVNLNSSFDIVSHDLETHRTTKGLGWDNDDNYFMYSDSNTSNPSKAIFVDNNSAVVEYESTKDSGNMLEMYEFVFDTTIYILSGVHTITWDAYYPENIEEISITIEGDETVVVYAENLGVDYIAQKSEFFIHESGYFNIIANQNIDASYNWGARNVIISRYYGLSRWMVMTQNTATNYSYDGTEEKEGEKYLDKVLVYGSDKYIPTEYSWWWSSDIGTLYNDAFDTKVGNRSLVVEYPTTSGVDVIKLTKNDTYGIDTDWDMLDNIDFWLFIEDINYFDTDYGDITLGAVNDSQGDFYFRWLVESMELHTGWNNVRLRFKNYNDVYPENVESGRYLHSNLDIRNTNRDFDELYIRIRGTGAGPLKIKLDGFNIKRNTFESKVNFGNGLCLTGSDSANFPLSNVTLSKGSIECWVKFGVDTIGRDKFGNLYATTVFTINNNNNDIIALRIKPSNWFEVIAGNIRLQSLFNVSDVSSNSFFPIYSIGHIGLVWSSDGTGMDNSDTIRLYINGVLKMVSQTTWDVGDTKLSFLKLGGGISQSELLHNNFSSLVYSNIKIYDYCKNSFKPYKEDISGDYLYLPEDFIELSKDNVNFYGAGSTELPFVFEQVPSGNFRKIYIRTNKNNKFNPNNSTAQILIDWLTTV